jgi:hypothetical protein
MGERLEDLGRELQPGPMEGRDVAPMSTRGSLAVCAGALLQCATVQRRASTYLLRQMIRADVEGSLAAFFAVDDAAGGVGASAGAEELVSAAAASGGALFFLRAMLCSG